MSAAASASGGGVVGGEPSATAAAAARREARPAGGQRRSLPTLNADGTRHVIRPRPSPGRFLRRRQIIGYALIALFLALPHLRINGHPPLLIDLVHREIALGGAVFRPSEGFLLMLLGLAVVLTVFLVTALWGRVWCGYACPQTVYLELVFRPIERWIEGPPAAQRKLDAKGWGARRLLKWAIYGALAFAIANVFLSYFVPTNLLWRWITSSPLTHPGGFAVVLAVTALMLFDFTYFREQMCTMACPYGRLQSVLLDRRTLVVGYDAQRGEPRGKARKQAGQPAGGVGDCVDCSACVTTCPTGIDIRDGLQMECIGCAQCIDACDAIMTKLERPRGLIRYASQEQLAGASAARTGARLRVWIYPALLAVVVGALVMQLVGRGDSEIWLLRNDEAAFEKLGDGRVSSLVRLKIENRSSSPHQYTFALEGDPGAELLLPRPRLELGADRAEVLSLFVLSPQRAFTGGTRHTTLIVREGERQLARLTVPLLGPEDGGAGAPASEPASEPTSEPAKEPTP